MTLTAKDVAEITKLLEESSFDELDLEIDGVKLSLRRGGAGAAVAVPSRSASTASTVSTAGAPDAASAAASSAARSTPGSPAAPAARPMASAVAGSVAHAPAPAADSNVHDVPAPLLGTFYRAPKPGAPPFVEIDSAVDEETVVGIIEVMKLMNTVRAGVSGRVTEIVARDGTLVEYGETLMRVGKTG